MLESRTRNLRLRLSLAAALAAALAWSAIAVAGPVTGAAPPRLPEGCLPVCQTNCLKPFAIADRWDDRSTIAGHEDWRGNGRWDQEAFHDLNGNGLYDPGDQFEDTNANGQHDSEAYNSLLTGYIPDPYPGNELSPEGDYGLQLLLKYGSEQRQDASHYLAIDLPAINRGSPITGGRRYRDNIEGCAQAVSWPGDWVQIETGNMAGPTATAVQALIARDPAARYDPATREIVGSIYQDSESPRLVIVPITDPRIVGKSGRAQLQLTKLAGFFIEELDDAGGVRGRFLKIRNPGPPCTCCGDLRVNWLRECP